MKIEVKCFYLKDRNQMLFGIAFMDVDISIGVEIIAFVNKCFIISSNMTFVMIVLVFVSFI